MIAPERFASASAKSGLLVSVKACPISSPIPKKRDADTIFNNNCALLTFRSSTRKYMYHKMVNMKWKDACAYLSKLLTLTVGRLLKFTKHSTIRKIVHSEAATSHSFLRTYQVFVIVGRQQSVEISHVGNFNLDHPALSVRIGIDRFRIAFQRIVELDDFASKRQEQI